MAIILCPECKSKISSKANTCPKCGCPITENSSMKICKINGVEYDLTDFDKTVDSETLQSVTKIARTLMHKYGIQGLDAKLIGDVIAFNNNQIPADYNEALEKMRASNRARRESAESSKPKCPMCGSTNISKISTLSRASSIVGFGILSKKIGKQWQCNNPKCKHMW